MKLNLSQAEAIMRLRGNADFSVFVGALESYGRECIHHAVYGTEDDSSVSRGMARSTSEVLRVLGDIENITIKMRSRG